MSTNEPPVRRSNDEPLLRMRGIAKIYRLGTAGRIVEALRGVDLEVEGGEFLAIMGPSGSGKSTLMNIIGCLDNPSDGSYVLEARDVSKLGERDLAGVRNAQIGFVFQSFNLLPRATALANVELPLVYAGVSKEERHNRAREALDVVGLADWADHRPPELSGGQAQRVAVARALVTRPRLLLADEPTGNLDSQSSQEILELFRELHRKGNTLILVTHEEEVARHAERLIHIRDGRIWKDERR